ASRNKSYRSEIEALRSRNRITGNTIQFINEAAAKCRDGSEGVCLTTNVLDECGATSIEMHLARLVAPLVRILRCSEFCDELVKRRMSITYARAVAEYGVERSGFTVV